MVLSYSVSALSRAMRHARHHRGAVTLLAIVAAGVFVFFFIADEMVEGEIQAFDETLLLALRTPGDLNNPIGPSWLEEAALEITSLGGYPVVILVTLLVLGYLVMDRKISAAFFVLVSVTGGAVLSSVLKLQFDRPRPDLVDHLDIIHTASFPSGHAMITTVAYLTLGSLMTRFIARRALRAYVLCGAVLIALLVGASRVYLGVHWPTDVAAGWALGAAWAALCWLAVSWLRDHPVGSGRPRHPPHHPSATLEN